MPILPLVSGAPLETRLKKAQEEKAQLAQQNAHLATSQRSTLETQLKKKLRREKAQLAQTELRLLSLANAAPWKLRLKKHKKRRRKFQQKEYRIYCL